MRAKQKQRCSKGDNQRHTWKASNRQKIHWILQAAATICTQKGGAAVMAEQLGKHGNTQIWKEMGVKRISRVFHEQ